VGARPWVPSLAPQDDDDNDNSWSLFSADWHLVSGMYNVLTIISLNGTSLSSRDDHGSFPGCGLALGFWRHLGTPPSHAPIYPSLVFLHFPIPDSWPSSLLPMPCSCVLLLIIKAICVHGYFQRPLF
jgi:hypothetical protein